MNFIETIINYLKKEEKSWGNTQVYNINHVSIDNFPKEAKLVPM